MQQLSDQSVNYSKLIFSESKGKIYIGGEEIKPELRSILREQARYLESSQLWEILLATANREAIDLALNKSTNWDHVQFAKALKYFIDIFETMLGKLKLDKKN